MVVTFLVLVVLLIGGFVSFAYRRAEERGMLGTTILVRKYKTTGSMQNDMNRLEAMGWSTDMHAAAAGFLTGTRSYSVQYHRVQGAPVAQAQDALDRMIDRVHEMGTNA